MPLILDVRTSFVMGVGIVAVTAFVLLLIAHDLPRALRASARRAGVASATLAVTWSLFAFGDELPELATILGGNLLYLVAGVLVHHSVRLFDGRPPRRDLAWKVVVPAIALTLSARYLVDAYAVRVIVMSASVAFLLGLSAARLVRRPSSVPDAFGRRLVAGWLGASAAILVARVGVTVVQGGAPPVLSNGTLATVAMAVSLVTILGLVFSYILLYTGRVTAELRLEAGRDPLTGLDNRRAFEARATHEIERAAREAVPLSVLLVDVDRFKAINDGWGHAAGDAALGAIAGSLRAGLRSNDVVARLGGDEFAVLLPGVGEDEARRVAGRLGRAVAAAPSAGEGALSVSIGHAALVADDDLHGLLARADVALYEVKRRAHPASSAPVPGRQPAAA